MQKEIDSDYPGVEISILGVNQADYENNETFCEGSDLPWLLDTKEADWWGSWGITYRDVVILNRDGLEAGVFNLTEYNLLDDEAYNTLRTLLFDTSE